MRIWKRAVVKVYFPPVFIFYVKRPGNDDKVYITSCQTYDASNGQKRETVLRPCRAVPFYHLN